jgi:hypothetical protein
MNDLDDVDGCSKEPEFFFFVFIVLRLLDCAVAGRLYGKDITTNHWQDEKLRVAGLFIIASHQCDAFDTTTGDRGAPEALLWGVCRPAPAGGGSSTITVSLYCINNNSNYYDPSLFFIIFLLLLLFFASQPIFIIIFIVLGLDRSQIRGHSRRPNRYEIYPQ